MAQIQLLAETESKPGGPFLKWAGGKSALLPQLEPFFPPANSYVRYFEPFLGGGAVFFRLKPRTSFLFDLNSALIEVYRIVQDNVEALIRALKPHGNDRDYFYHVRSQDPMALTPVERAARFIFLNRTCYNGLYRVNRNGQFNVPFGRYANPTICDEPGLKSASALLQGAALNVADFADALSTAGAGDFVYFDPPYEPLSASSSFTSYTSAGFSREDQRRLADVYAELDARGCLLMLSNSNAPLIHHLYRRFHIHSVNARRAINSKGGGRGPIPEVVITNYEATGA